MNGRKRIPGVARGMSLRQLSKGLFICGMPGSGKTAALMNLLAQLSEGKIPFLVIEPMKKDFRLLKSLMNHPKKEYRDLATGFHLYTFGNEGISPGRLAPLKLMRGMSKDEHIGNLLHAASASMPLSSSLPFLLGEAFEEVYETHPDPTHAPIVADSIVAAQRVMSRKGYSLDTGSDVGTALLTRLAAWNRRAMGKILQCSKSIPSIETIMESQSLLELDDMQEDEACILILLLFTLIREYVKTTPWRGKGLRFVLILDEAHVVIGRKEEASSSEDHADPKGNATQFICRMMAEMRGAGVGMVTADQHASAIAPSVIKNAGSQLAFRQTSAEDRQIVVSTMLLSRVQAEELARLAPGEAFYFTEGFHRARQLRTVNLHEDMGAYEPPTDEELLEIVRKEPWWREAARERRALELMQLSGGMADLGRRLRDWLPRAAQLHVRAASRIGAEDRTRLHREARQLRTEIDSHLEEFRRETYRPLLGEAIPEDIGVLQPLAKLRQSLQERFESAIQSSAQAAIECLNKTIGLIGQKTQREVLS